MISKQRHIPEELLVLRYLRGRQKELDVEHLKILEKGFSGELQWDSFVIDTLTSSSYLLLNDLLLTSSGGQMFQIDSLLLRKKFFIFEVKNYDGEYFVENDRWYSIGKTEIQNPLIQLQRTETGFRRLLKDLGIHLPVEAYVVFVNPEFTLFNAPHHPSLLLPSQLKRFILKMKQETYEMTKKDQIISNKISACHIEKSPYVRLPSYSYEDLEKGIRCGCCGRFLFPLSQSYVYCEMCRNKEAVETAVLRNVTEYQTLFPQKLVTTIGILEWCGGIVSEKTIRRILKKNFKTQGANRHTHFI
ncbi:NERD domain-containing protein [Robertmurraya korlensis]|uniref:nuclease-related domain-containing protein n=1 Tax=Robertmurraya korlensis TaxID=519977 RepID=UPI0020420787|nr:nuclease-related domain-containing protein [Robertmurraya korlensis]MCM3599225.1 NERD domain-containing protein [Robertmurraya korlensis]